MKRHKGLGLSWACGHGQHALDEHDRDTQQHHPIYESPVKDGHTRPVLYC